MFEFGFLPYQKASTIGEGVFHSRESEQGVGSLSPPYVTPVRNTDTGHPSKYLPHSAIREKMSCEKPAFFLILLSFFTIMLRKYFRIFHENVSPRPTLDLITLFDLQPDAQNSCLFIYNTFI
jgi:hypothetical protein